MSYQSIIAELLELLWEYYQITSQYQFNAHVDDENRVAEIKQRIRELNQQPGANNE